MKLLKRLFGSSEGCFHCWDFSSRTAKELLEMLDEKPLSLHRGNEVVKEILHRLVKESGIK